MAILQNLSIVKLSLVHQTKLFHDTGGIGILVTGKHLWAQSAIDCVASYVRSKVASWVSEIENLLVIAG